jgi:hypothetical protein
MVKQVLRNPDGRYWFRHSRRGSKREELLIGRAWPFKQGEIEEVNVPIAYYSDFAFSSDGRLFILFDKDEHFTIQIFSFPAMELIDTIPLSFRGGGSGGVLRFSPCGRLLAVIGSSAHAVLNSSTLSVLAELSIEYGSDVDFSPTDPLMAIGAWSAGEVFDTTPYMKASST